MRPRISERVGPSVGPSVGSKMLDFKLKKVNKKRYMVSGSLYPTSFIKVESPVSIVVVGQWPHRGRYLTHQKERPYDTSEEEEGLEGFRWG